MQKRIGYIDCIRGAALCVVIGHVISKFDLYADTNVIFMICYSFHMYLFMFLSGWLVGSKVTVSSEWLKKKAKRLLIPYLIWKH